ncbi:MAG: lysine--tRNA ligase [Candidatus Pacebacteria bacterium]|nr:lysine--tRNA ligase [Candidatus Paceibacterota bacterium]
MSRIDDTHNEQQSLHWADKLAKKILKWQRQQDIKELHIDDMKTPSGRVHTGALRGVILHDLVQKTLLDQLAQTSKNQEVVSTYVFNDMDPMDGLPAYLDRDQYLPYMGKPLFQIPAPSLAESGVDFSTSNQKEKVKFSQAKSFAEFYALDFIEAFRYLGCDQKIIWSHELYQSGAMNQVIKLVLDNVDQVKQVYQKVADYQLPVNWYPFQVICPSCGKIGTTLVTGWDGELVSFECQPNLVDWAKGCGYKGKISPFDGAGKLLWKVDWPAHWKVMGVNVEGAGKDHTSAGGSRDMGNALVKNVLDYIVPFDIPYEWILIRGAKMSSSKGVGASAREFVDLFKPEVGRFLFVSKHFNQVIDFDPSSETIPDLYDLYDQGCRIYWGQEEGDERLARAVELSQIDSPVPKPQFLPRFRDVVVWMQHPELDLEQEFEKVKGEPLTESEKQELDERVKRATIWLDRYAPQEYQLTPTQDLPATASSISSEQLEFVKQVFDWIVEGQAASPEDLQQKIYQLAKSTVGAKKGFQAIYQVLIGKTHGPRAAWLLLDTSTELLQDRIEQLEKISQVKNE